MPNKELYVKVWVDVDEEEWKRSLSYQKFLLQSIQKHWYDVLEVKDVEVS